MVQESVSSGEEAISKSRHPSFQPLVYSEIREKMKHPVRQASLTIAIHVPTTFSSQGKLIIFVLSKP